MKEKIVQICYQKFCSIKYHNEEVEVRADAVEGGANETEGGADEVEGGADVEEE